MAPACKLGTSDGRRFLSSTLIHIVVQGEKIMRETEHSRFKGQTLVEFALVLPIMLLVLFAIIEIARLLHAWVAIENGARFGVRYAVTGEYESSYCAGYPGGICDDQSEEDAARIPSIKDNALSGSAGIMRDLAVPSGAPGYMKITVCSNKAGIVYLSLIHI